MEDLIEKYFSNEEIRLKIKSNAGELAKLKHTYIIKTQNLMDIINNKAEEFYGFIKKVLKLGVFNN